VRADVVEVAYILLPDYLDLVLEALPLFGLPSLVRADSIA
jgi:hypothetical protein